MKIALQKNTSMTHYNLEHKQKSLSHYNLVHIFIPMPQAMKIPDAADKEWKKLETIPAWGVRKVKSKKVIKVAARLDSVLLEMLSGISKAAQRRKSINGLLKNQSSITLEDWEALISSIRKMEITRKPLTNARTKLEIPMEAATPCKMETNRRRNPRFRQNPKDKACMHRGGS